MDAGLIIALVLASLYVGGMAGLLISPDYWKHRTRRREFEHQEKMAELAHRAKMLDLKD